jgi:hypothetical protein
MASMDTTSPAAAVAAANKRVDYDEYGVARTRPRRHDVFINHRGVDTKRTYGGAAPLRAPPRRRRHFVPGQHVDAPRRPPGGEHLRRRPRVRRRGGHLLQALLRLPLLPPRARRDGRGAQGHHPRLLRRRAFRPRPARLRRVPPARHRALMFLPCPGERWQKTNQSSTSSSSLIKKLQVILAQMQHVVHGSTGH